MSHVSWIQPLCVKGRDGRVCWLVERSNIGQVVQQQKALRFLEGTSLHKRHTRIHRRSQFQFSDEPDFSDFLLM